MPEPDGPQFRGTRQLGNCHSVAFGVCRSFEEEGRENVAIVHAQVDMLGEGRRLAHAWVEYDKPTNGGTQRMAADHSGRVYEGPAEEYREALGVQDTQEYSGAEAALRMARSGQTGPWDD